MPIELEASNSLQAAKEIAGNLPGSTTESARKLYSVLLALSFDWIEHKAYRAIPTHVTFHSSLTLCAAVVGIDRVTAWRSLRRLKALGVVDWRSHKCMFRGRASNSGSIFQVRLNPSAGSKARLSYDDLRHDWKDLEKAAQCKRLAGTMLQHIQALESKSLKYDSLKLFSLKPYLQLEPVKKLYRLQPRLEDVLAVASASGKEVAESVDRAAVALAQALQDSKSIDWYRKLLWALKRRYSATGNDEFYTLYLQVQRVLRADVPEWQGLRSAGALLTSRLKKYAWWEEEMRT